MKTSSILLILALASAAQAHQIDVKRHVSVDRFDRIIKRQDAPSGGLETENSESGNSSPAEIETTTPVEAPTTPASAAGPSSESVTSPESEASTPPAAQETTTPETTSAASSSAPETNGDPVVRTTTIETTSSASSAVSNTGETASTTASTTRGARTTEVIVTTTSESTESTSSSDPSSTGAASAKPESSGLSRGTLVTICIVGGIVALIAAIWTIIRKTKFSPSKHFESKMDGGFAPHKERDTIYWPSPVEQNHNRTESRTSNHQLYPNEKAGYAESLSRSDSGRSATRSPAPGMMDNVYAPNSIPYMQTRPNYYGQAAQQSYSETSYGYADLQRGYSTSQDPRFYTNNNTPAPPYAGAGTGAGAGYNGPRY